MGGAQRRRSWCPLRCQAGNQRPRHRPRPAALPAAQPGSQRATRERLGDSSHGQASAGRTQRRRQAVSDHAGAAAATIEIPRGGAAAPASCPKGPGLGTASGPARDNVGAGRRLQAVAVNAGPAVAPRPFKAREAAAAEGAGRPHRAPPPVPAACSASSLLNTRARVTRC
jgi:hypothetical protein